MRHLNRVVARDFYGIDEGRVDSYTSGPNKANYREEPRDSVNWYWICILTVDSLDAIHPTSPNFATTQSRLRIEPWPEAFRTQCPEGLVALNDYAC